ncbi:MAG TPA: hypothetical protein VI564_08730 [Candidatus Nanoarchaeia archaeon]|nr:hypothetical protein [Candidatus Nanoarchaeia archaeon]
MKIRALPLLIAVFFVSLGIVTKHFNYIAVLALGIAVLVDYFSRMNEGTKNLVYIISAFSYIPQMLGIFLVFLPFCVFGFLISKRSFAKNYILAFALFFIPVNLVYLITTYTQVSLNYPLILAICYFMPVVAAVFLKKKAVSFFEVKNREAIFFVIILMFTSLVAVSIIDNKSLFMVNGIRIFSRVNVALEGLRNEGMVPIYNPGIADGESTYLWNTPSFKVGAALVAYLNNTKTNILFFNAQMVFTLFLSVLGLGLLFGSIVKNYELNENFFLVIAIALMTGLNFYFLKGLESYKAYYIYPIAYLFLLIILDNPRKLLDFMVLGYIAMIFTTTHLPYGSGIIVIGFCALLLTKFYWIKDRSELKSVLNIPLKKKIVILAVFLVVFIMPLYYLSAGLIYKDFLKATTIKITPQSMKTDFISTFSAIKSDMAAIFSLKIPEIQRIDDHRVGFFFTILGALSVLMLVVSYKSEDVKKFRALLLGFVIALAVSGLFYSKITASVGGFFRTNIQMLLILAGASIAVFVSRWNNKKAKYAFIALAFALFLYYLPYSQKTIRAIHEEAFAGGDIYKQELDLIRALPADARIMDYGVFNNAIDFGGNYLTGKYFSRDERDLMNIERRIFERVHGQNSFGEPDIVMTKSGTELSNYLIMGGYKYLFINGCHPIGNYVVSVLYPNYTYPIYQNGCFLFLVVNNTNYAEKVDLVKNLSEEIYKEKDAYRFISVSPHYDFNEKIDYVQNPKFPQGLNFERVSFSEVRILGDFDENDYVVFKEHYFPRWKAYMDGKEVPVLSTLHEKVLIKTIKGSEITLKYVVLAKEKVFGYASLFAHFFFIAALFYFAKEFEKSKEYD